MHSYALTEMVHYSPAVFVSNEVLLCPCPPLLAMHDISLSNYTGQDSYETLGILDRTSNISFSLLVEGGVNPLASSMIKYYQVPVVSLVSPLSDGGDTVVLVNKEPSCEYKCTSKASLGLT